MELKDNERVDEVNDKISLIQDTSGLTFGTDALLLAGYIKGKFKKCCELGGGTGIISMLALTRDKCESVDCVEIQEEFCDLIRRNAELNSLGSRLSVLQCDLRSLAKGGEYDLVFTNPPYMKTDTGKANLEEKKNIARHEVAGDIGDFCRTAAGLLKFGGSFYVVYRPDRAVDLICAMRDAGIEPKRMTFVSATTEHSPSIMLVEGRRGGRCGLTLTPNLYLYREQTRRYGEDMQAILDTGTFPAKFTLK